MDEEEIIQLLIQIAEGLEAAHAKGVVHRGLTHESVLVSEDGQVRIIGWGTSFFPALTQSRAPDLSHPR
jgi:serine/threonine protein kinase